MIKSSLDEKLVFQVNIAQTIVAEYLDLVKELVLFFCILCHVSYHIIKNHKKRTKKMQRDRRLSFSPQIFQKPKILNINSDCLSFDQFSHFILGRGITKWGYSQNVVNVKGSFENSIYVDNKLSLVFISLLYMCLLVWSTRETINP